MNTNYYDALRDHGQTLITHIALFNDSGAEISGGSYARQAVTWVDDGTGVMRPSGDLTFDIPGGSTVAEWRGFDALTGGTDYGGADLTPESYAGDGTYTLLASQTSVTHSGA